MCTCILKRMNDDQLHNIYSVRYKKRTKVSLSRNKEQKKNNFCHHNHFLYSLMYTYSLFYFRC